MEGLLIVGAVMVTMLAGGLLVGGAARRRFAHAPGAFRCQITLAGRRRRFVPQRWVRRLTWAAWSHDVLLAHRGVLRPRVVVYPIRFPDGAMARLQRDEVASKLGENPLRLPLRCDDEALLEVVAAGGDCTLLAGPFLAAAMPGLPRAPIERRLRDR